MHPLLEYQRGYITAAKRTIAFLSQKSRLHSLKINSLLIIIVLEAKGQPLKEQSRQPICVYVDMPICACFDLDNSPDINWMKYKTVTSQNELSHRALCQF